MVRAQKWSLLLSVFVFLVACSGSDSQTSTKPLSTTTHNAPESTAYVRGSVSYIVQCETTCDAVATQVERAGGTVVRRFSNIAAMTVNLPAGTASTLADIPGVKGASKNSKLSLPSPSQLLKSAKTAKLGKALRPLALKPAKSGSVGRRPNDFGSNNILINASAIQETGQLGDDVVVAVIDSGVANNADVVPALADSVIGGESFISDADPGEPSATSTLNEGHGTFVSTQIAGHAEFAFPADHDFVLSMLEHMPESLTKQADGTYLVPMTGVAPGAKIYALKVFSALGMGGASDSDVLAAMDRALTLKLNFDAGKPTTPVSGTGTEDDPYIYDALNIQVVNMSLGGPGLNPGYDTIDLLTLEMLKAGINVVLSAGNDGPAAMTVGSPASGAGALSVGAASDAAHERIEVDMMSALGDGILFRPVDGVQTAIFSSRGPLADGRFGVDVVAPGVGNFGMTADGDFHIGDGTSYSAPQVAGAAALLHGAFPAASAAQIRNAIMSGANAALLVDKPTRNDQGGGFLDVGASHEMLAAGGVSSTIPALRTQTAPTRVSQNIRRAGVTPISFSANKFTTTVELVPGQVAQFLIDNSSRDIYTIDVQNTRAELPPEQQNPLFGDGWIFAILDGEWSFADTQFSDLMPSGATFREFTRFQNGLPRIVLMGDWTNVGKISLTLTVTVERVVPTTLPGTLTGTIADQTTKFYNLSVPGSNSLAFFNLSWPSDWRFYPTHDIDLLVATPEGDLNIAGATLASPESFMLARLPRGTYTLIVDGYAVHGMDETFSLSVTDQNDQPLRITRRRTPPVVLTGPVPPSDD